MSLFTAGSSDSLQGGSTEPLLGQPVRMEVFMGTSVDVVCSRCGSVVANCAWGENGETLCYSCCAEIEKQFMRDYGAITLYLNLTAYHTCEEVLNWPGTLRFKVLECRKGNHNFAGIRRDVWFEFEGWIWHGVQYGDYSELCHCRITKRKVRV
jgi:hypothetical protein